MERHGKIETEKESVYVCVCVYGQWEQSEYRIALVDSN